MAVFCNEVVASGVPPRYLFDIRRSFCKIILYILDQSLILKVKQQIKALAKMEGIEIDATVCKKFIIDFGDISWKERGRESRGVASRWRLILSGPHCSDFKRFVNLHCIGKWNKTDFALSCSQWEQQPLFGARFAAIWCGSQYARLPQKYSNFRRHWTRTRRMRQGNAQGEGHQPRHQGKKMVRLLIIIIHSHESLSPFIFIPTIYHLFCHHPPTSCSSFFPLQSSLLTSLFFPPEFHLHIAESLILNLALYCGTSSRWTFCIQSSIAKFLLLQIAQNLKYNCISQNSYS